MKKTADYLKDAQKALNHKTDGDTMRWLGVSRGAVSRYLSGKSVIDSDDVVWKIAEALGIDPAEIMAARAIERAERSDDQAGFALWTKRFKAVSHSATSLFFGSALLGGAVEAVRHCILC
ncbi:helix-turn-helix domain-containing protein [Alcanivorax sp.]|uniref:helix-turn-helix domain-containing protein n=1 Tax=Alcanivorax sp. TaxID=1872427 RepID=UPI002B27A013|nr:helix-turn-helix domain-containing protein [Alcanivorax sp.]